MSRVQIEEDSILDMIEVFDDEDEDTSSLLEVLELGSTYRKEGLTPFYIYDPLRGSFMVTSEEQMDNKLH